MTRAEGAESTDIFVSVIIPAYNEEEGIESSLNKVAEFLFRHFQGEKPFEIIVVNDGSTDHTGEIVDRLAEKRDYLTVRHHTKNLGRGRGLRTGFAAARGKYVFCLDADLSYDPEHMAKMLPYLERGEADLVLASAYHKEGSVKNVPLFRQLVSRWGNKLLSVAVSGELKTLTCIVRGYTRRLLDDLELFGDDKDLHLEIIHKTRLLGYNIVEVPAHLRWGKEKCTSGRRGLSVKNFKQMSSQHLFFNFLFRPSRLLWVPIMALSVLILFVFGMTVRGYIHMYATMGAGYGWLKPYFALREHIIEAKISYLFLLFGVLFLLQFISTIFLAKQSNYHYFEIFSFLTRLKKMIRNRKEEP